LNRGEELNNGGVDAWLKVDEFKVENFLNKYEMDVEINLGETCVKPFTLKEFLNLVDRPNFFEEFQDKQLTYGWIEGSPKLRRGIAGLYESLEDSNILITGGAIGANFLTEYTFVEPRDEAICVHPTYQQLYSIPKSFGADVKLLKLDPEEEWSMDLLELEEMIKDETKMLILNNPNNPTGKLIKEGGLKEIISLAQDVDAYILCDESYRGLYIHPEDDVPSIVDLYDKGIGTGSFSKVFSLTGLRLGWIAAEEGIIEECMQRRNYVTISNGMIDDALAALSMDKVDKILGRSHQIVRRNYEIVDDWIEGEPLIDWVPPEAGSVGFMRYYINIPSEEFCIKLLEDKSTLLVPGSCFDFDNHLRIGIGNPTETIKEGLERLKDFLRTI
jgi:aspartate/methionine/tyrosine aminotransferase